MNDRAFSREMSRGNPRKHISVSVFTHHRRHMLRLHLHRFVGIGWAGVEKESGQIWVRYGSL